MTLASRLRLASALSGSNGGTTAQESATMRTSAVATVPSDEGYVTVEFEDGSQMEVPTLASVSAGDEVQVLVDGNDAIALGSGGWGDDLSDATMEAWSIGEAAQTIAEEAQAVANATNQHFWTSTKGVHISTDESNQYGERNMLLNSLGMLFRKGVNYLVSITESALAFWDGLGNGGSHVLASFGANGVTIGKANEVNTWVGVGGFDVRSGKESAFNVTVEPQTFPAGIMQFPVRRIYKVYKAGYLDSGQYIDQDLLGRVDTPLEDPDVKLYFGDTWYSDGTWAGYTNMLMDVEEFAALAQYYSAAGSSVEDNLDSYYSKTVSDYYGDQSGAGAFRTTRFWFTDNTYMGAYFMSGFSQTILDQIPQDVWTDEAIAAGEPNWFIGSVYDVPIGKAYVNGEKLATLGQLADATADMLTTSSELFKIVNVSYTTASIAVNNGVSSSMSIASSVPDGYTAIGIVGTQSNHGQNWYDNSYVNVSTQTLYYNIKHAFGSGSESCTLTWKLLCIPSGNYS